MLIGIGIDDVFVIVSSIELTDPNLPLEERYSTGLKSSGLAITLTSVTNFCAFIMGFAFTEVPAIQSFCFYTGMGIFFDFITTLTVFTAFLVFDMRRTIDLKGDCCGMCICDPLGAICCGGKLTPEAYKDEN